jgi:hypothetical protein
LRPARCLSRTIAPSRAATPGASIGSGQFHPRQAAPETKPAPRAMKGQKVCQHLPTLLVSKCRFHAPRTFLFKQRFRPLFMLFP